MSVPWIHITLRPIDGQPMAEIFEHVIAIPHRGDSIVARGVLFEVREVTHFASSHEGGPAIVLSVERIGRSRL